MDTSDKSPKCTSLNELKKDDSKQQLVFVNDFVPRTSNRKGPGVPLWNSAAAPVMKKGKTTISGGTLLKQYMVDRDIRTDVQYKQLLREDELFYSQVLQYEGTNLEHIKRAAYELANAKVPLQTLSEILQESELEPDDLTKGIAYKFFETIAQENNTSLGILVYNIMRILNLDDAKIRSLVTVGQSNSGKTYLNTLLTAAYEINEIGVLQTPGTHLNTFWMSDLLGKKIAVWEEALIATPQVAQATKQLMEGNRLLKTDVKYQSHMGINPMPLLMTLNGSNIYDLTRHVSEEADTIANRCYAIKMSRPLLQRLTNTEIQHLIDNKQLIPLIINNIYIKEKEKKANTSPVLNISMYSTLLSKYTY